VSMVIVMVMLVVVLVGAHALGSRSTTR
jgi:hypothetical protein